MTQTSSPAARTRPLLCVSTGRMALINDAALGHTRERLAAGPTALNAVQATIGKARTGDQPDLLFIRLIRAIAYPAAMTANHAPKSTCFWRLTIVCTRTCSAGTSRSVRASVAISVLTMRPSCRASIIPSAERTMTREVHTYERSRITEVGEEAAGRFRVVDVMPCQ